jgi:O-antigen ligase
LVERRVKFPTSARVAFVGVLVVVLVGLGSAAWAEWGSPVEISDRVWEDIHAPPNVSRGDLGARLFDLSAAGRLDHWRVAWDGWQANPVIGSGAGTYWQTWAAERPYPGDVRDAHSLYLETLAELGVVGLVLLVGALLLPAFAAMRARAMAIVPAAFGAYVAWLAHAGIDWDWELLGVTLATLAVGVALIAAARGERTRAPVPRWLIPGAAALLTVPALAGVLAYSPLASAREALNELRLEQAAQDARTAQRFAPWASEPWVILGDAKAENDSAAARKAYREALERDGSSWELWLALAAVSSGEERRVALARAAELNPLSADIRQLREAVGSTSSS